MKQLIIRTQILLTTYLTLARQFWWHRRKSSLHIFGWIIGLVEYVLAILGSIVFICIYPNRSTIVFGIFNWMRLVDDMIDGDNPKALSIDIQTFIAVKSKVLEEVLLAKIHQNISDADIYDKGMAYAFIQADKMGIGHIVRAHISTIWNLMIKEKRMFGDVVSKAELDSFAQIQDKAIGELMCVLMGGDSTTLNQWWSNRGVFTKIDWVLDIDADLAHGLIHIPKETLEVTQSSLDTLLGSSTDTLIARFTCMQYEMKEIDRQWKEVLKDRDIFVQSFSNPFMKIIFNSLAIGGFDRRVKRLKMKYQITD